ncbi:VPS10 domain-containing protein [Adonisia turfae]|nr:YCF48-related protein [Adonisia turfae]
MKEMITRWSSTISKALFSWIFCLLIILVAWNMGVPPAYAHRPHDVVPQVVVSPNYEQDSTVYALVRKNLLRSKDQGETWFRLNNGLDNHEALVALAIAPGDQSTLYLTTAGDGIYGSKDGGNTWKPFNAGLGDLDLQWVEASPVNAQLAFTQSHDGRLYRTDNGGEQWSMVLANVAATELAFDPENQFLLLGDDQGQIWRSEDNGVTWTTLTQIPDTGIVEAIAASPSVIYVGTESDGVYQSTDNAKSFSPVSDGLLDLRTQDLAFTPDGNLWLSTWEAGTWQWDPTEKVWITLAQGLTRDQQADDMEVPHFEELAVSPGYAKDSTLFLGGFDGLFRSQDNGQQWEQLEVLSLGTVVSMAVSPTFAEDQTVAIATYVGELYISNDAGNTWQSINEGLHLPLFTNSFKPLDAATSEQDPRRFFDIALSSNYADDQTLFSSILYTKILRSANGGQNWSVHPLSQEVRGVSLGVSPNFKADQTVFSTNQKGLVFRSQDAGKTYERVGQLDKQLGNDSPSLVISPDFANDQTLFNTGIRGVYKSENAGQKWSLLTENTDLEELPFAQIAVSPNVASDQTLFVASGKGLYRTEDGGKTWEHLDGKGYGANPFIEAVDISPNYVNDKTVIASVRGRGLFKSEDGGNSFKAIGDPNLAFSRYTHVPCAGRALQFSPNYAEDNTIFGFGAVDTAIYRSTDGGENWDVLSVPRLKIAQIAAPSTPETVGMYLRLNKRKLTGFGVLAILAASGIALFKRISFERISTRNIRLIICLAGVVGAVGWVAFERLFAPQQSAENGFFICLGFAAVSWLVTSPWFVRRFVPETTAESLAAIRIVSCGTLVLMTLWMEDLPSSALLPIEIRHSMGVMDYFYNIPGFEAFSRHQPSLQLFEWITALVLILGTIGLKTRWVLPLGALFYLVLGGILRQYTWFYHTGLLPVYLLAVLSFAPCNDALSVDRWLKQRRGEPVPVADEPAPIYAWARYACWLILGVSYIQAGLSKIYFSGFYWWAPQNLKAKLLSTTLEPLQTDWTISLHLVHAPDIVFGFLGFVGIYGELAYGLVLFSRWARWIMPAAMAAMHVGIIFLQNIVFFDLILVQLIFYDYTAIRRWLNRRGWFKFAQSNSPKGETLRPKRIFFYPILVSVLIVTMSFIWVKHREYYPLTSLQMFSGYDDSGMVGYNKLIAHYDSGEKVHEPTHKFIYAPMNTRYRLTFRDCHQEVTAKVKKCDSLLQAFGDVHNQKAQGENRITAFEVQRWVWDYFNNPSDPNYGKLEKTHFYKYRPRS